MPIPHTFSSIKKGLLLTVLVMTLAIGLTPANAIAADASSYKIETVAQNLNFPWCVAFLPDGRMLVTERAGALRYVTADGVVSKRISGTPKPWVRSQGGLFDVLLAPDFATSGIVYLSLAAGDADYNATRIVRGQLQDMAFVNPMVVFEVSFKKDTPVHYGGRLAWDSTGHLLLTTGDGFNFREEAQNPASQMGKTLRMTPLGAVPADQPIQGVAGVDPYVYSYGHRNPQGLAVDPVNGVIYQHEHGPRGGDEINIIEPGNNYGWPITSHGVDYSGALISPFSEYPGMTPPLLHWTPSIAASGLAIYQGTAFPNWQGDLFAGALVEKSLRRIDLENGQVVGQDILLRELDERIRDVRVGPDGFIYILTDTDNAELLRLIPPTPKTVPTPGNLAGSR